MGDWDREPKAPPSVWLKLKSAGEVATIRIAAAPLREVNIWPAEQGGKPLDSTVVENFTSGQWMSIMRSVDWEIREAYILLVIDRADNNAKIYRVSGALYGLIRDYAQNPKWGNPTTYDFDITRTEKPGSYWDVKADPNKTPLLTSEVDKVRALDLAKLVPNALPTDVPQPDEIDEMVRPEPLPWEQTVAQRRETVAPVAAVVPEDPPYEDTAPAPGDEDVVIEDIDDAPINLDDIKFN